MRNKWIKLVASAALYGCFAGYLYSPYLGDFTIWKGVLLVSGPAAALGCYVLSERWTASFGASFFAGAIYGFGPFMLWLGRFHPTTVLLAASIPWLFCPAAFGPAGKWRWARIPLAALPFATIILFFLASSQVRFFAMPLQSQVHAGDMLSLMTPLVAAKKGLTCFGFYHVAAAPLIIGFAMLFNARRAGVIAAFGAGLILALCPPMLNVSPVFWLAIPVACSSVIIGVGLQGLVSSGFKDRVWVISTGVLCAGLAITSLLLAASCFQIFAGLGDGYARLLVTEAWMYVLAVIACAAIFFLDRTKLRLHWLREVIIFTALAVDICLSSRYMVDVIL